MFTTEAAEAAVNPWVSQTSLAKLEETTIDEEIDLDTPEGAVSSLGADGAAPAGRLAARLGAAEEKSGEERRRTAPLGSSIGSSLDGSLEANTEMELELPAKEAPVVDLEDGLAAPGGKTTFLIADGDDPEASAGEKGQQASKPQQTVSKCSISWPQTS